MSIKIKFFITVWATILLSVITTGVAHAASQAITLTPTSNSPLIEPGGVYSNKYTIINQGQKPYNFSTYSAPYRVQGENYTPEFTLLPSAANVASWFSISQKNGYIKPGQVEQINYKIHVPAGTAPGGYYAVIFAETNLSKTSSGLTLNERVGEIFYIQVAGPVVQKANILTWSSNFLQSPPLIATLRLENSGGLHYQANIVIRVSDILGHTKYVLSTQKEVLPQTIRRINLAWSKTPPIGLFKVNGTVSFLNKTNKLPTKWVLVMSPLVKKIVIGVIIVIILLFVTRFYYKHHSVRKRTKHVKSR